MAQQPEQQLKQQQRVEVPQSKNQKTCAGLPCTPRIGKTTAERIVKDMKG